MLQNISDQLSGLTTTVNRLVVAFGEMKEDISVLKTDVAVLKTDVAVLKTDVSELKNDMVEVKSNITGLIETVEFIKDTAVTRDEFNELKSEVKSLENTIISGFGSNHTELQEIKKELSEVKTELAKLEQRTREDSDTIVKEIVHLQIRVERLEKKVEIFQTA